MRRLPPRALRGLRAEDAAETHLRSLGMRILGRNVRVSRLELDLVALDDDAVVVVEVRARGPTAWARPLHSIDARKREHIRRAASILWARRWSRLPAIHRVRFDVVSVDVAADGSHRVRHLRAAFT